MVSNFTQIQYARISTNFLTFISESDATATLMRLLPENKLTERKLQAMVTFLGLDVDLESAAIEELKRYVGGYLHSIVQPSILNPAPEFSSTVVSLQNISNRETIREELFDFLYKFGREGAHTLLARFNILNRDDITLIFSRAYPLEMTVRCLFDSASTAVPLVVLSLPSLKKNALTLKVWDSRIDWFKSGSQINQKRIDVANLYFSKQKVWQRPFFKLDDVRDFFYGISSDGDKELVFRRIRANYLNKKSREESDAKQCNFSLGKHSEKMINDLAKEYGVTRSVALDAILHSGSKKDMQDLFEKGIKNLPVPMKKLTNDLPKFSFNIGANVSTMVYKVNSTSASATSIPESDRFVLRPSNGKDWLG
ncbi:hypothetical protein ACQYWY_09760 [Comamonas sediminis]|uniref:hypothetical protein n=1 Tax=Comamonas sediminis TaxID=1783360 RepID=UPI003D2E115C